MNWIIIRINPAVDCKSISISKNHIHWIYNPLYAKILKTRIRIVDMWINPETLGDFLLEKKNSNLKYFKNKLRKIVLRELLHLGQYCYNFMINFK